MNTIRKCRLVGLFLGVILILNTASASLLLEPHLSYILNGSGDNGGVEYDYSGPQIGGRVGYQNLGFMTGVDYTRSSGEIDAKAAGVTVTRDFSGDAIGVFVGYNFPILVRAWGTYYFSNNVEYKGSGELDGNAKELGVGFTGLPFLSINVIYRMTSFDEFKAVGGAKSSVDHDYNEIVLGVSLPFTL